jgi:hypothetical protein
MEALDMRLFGSGSVTSECELGADQAIIVRDVETREMVGPTTTHRYVNCTCKWQLRSTICLGIKALVKITECCWTGMQRMPNRFKLFDGWIMDLFHTCTT